jgi:hypothetical protein
MMAFAALYPSYGPNLPDPRRETKNKLHKLEDIVRIVLCAVLSGIEDWIGMKVVAEERGGLVSGISGVAEWDSVARYAERCDESEKFRLY